jgi:hypothetical protein
MISAGKMSKADLGTFPPRLAAAKGYVGSASASFMSPEGP